MCVTSARVNDAPRRRPPLIAILPFAALLAAAPPGAAPAALAAPGQPSAAAGRALPALLVPIHATILMNGGVCYDADGESQQHGGAPHGRN